MIIKQLSANSSNHFGGVLTQLSTRDAAHRGLQFQASSLKYESVVTERLIWSRRRALALLSGSFSSCILSRPAKGNSQSLEDKVTEFTLPNGLHFIVLERHVAPTVSCHTYANVGAFEEQEGRTGLAHMLEHEAFKGTSRIGTSDWRKEKPLLDAQDSVFYSMREELDSGNVAEAARLAGQLQALQLQASQYSISNDFGARLSEAGAVGLNASTSHDATRYVASLPSNVLELWFALESERFQDPVFRELYSEKRVVLEERRARVDNSPLGQFQENFNRQAFANAYSRPVIGFREDIEAFGRRELAQFYHQYYGPQNLTISIVGDVTADQVFRFATRYFAGWRPNTEAESSSVGSAPATAVQSRPRRFEQAASGGPAVMKACYRPPVVSSDAVALEIIGEVLVGSRSARLERKLVQSGKAYSTSFLPAFPGDKHQCACMLYAIPAKDVTFEAMERHLTEEMQALASSGVTAKELTRIKKAAKLDLAEAVRFNAGMAGTLCSYHALTGSWKTLLHDFSVVDDLTSDDIRAVAAKTFQPENTFTGWVLPKGPLPVAAKPQQAI